jgi:hypothetical protein
VPIAWYFFFPKTQNPNFRGRAIQDLVFPAAKTDLEGGVDGRGFFD